MELILLERVKNLGDLGDTVKVKGGYGRNYLLPKGMALPATDSNRKIYEQRKAELVKKAQDSLNAARERATHIDGLTLNVPMLASDEGKLYGSVGAAEIVQAASLIDIDLKRHEVDLPDGPIRTTGSFSVVARLHSEVTVHFTVIVVEGTAT